MAEEKKGVKKYFETVIPEGEHMSDKTDEEGNQFAIKFFDEGNSLNGPLRVKEIDPIQESKKVDLMIAKMQRETAVYELEQRKQRHKDFVEGVEAINQLGQTVEELIPYGIQFYLWCRYTAYPTVKFRTIPWIKTKASGIVKHVDHVRRNKAIIEEKRENQPLFLGQITPDEFRETASKAHYYYKLNASEEEAREHFLNIVALAAKLAEEIRFFSEHTVVPDNIRFDEIQQQKWRIALEEFATENVAKSINSILQSEPRMLMEPSVINLFQAIGGKVSEENTLLPLEYQDFKEALCLSE